MMDRIGDGAALGADSGETAPSIAILGDVEAELRMVRALLGRRRDLLDALPIAAAVVCRTPDGDLIQGANGQFERVCGCSQPATEDEPWPLSSLEAGCGALVRAVDAFLSDACPAQQSEWRDGGHVGGRHFTVRLALLKPDAASLPRCLLTLVDRTAEVETARSLRSEMLHDSLTGLANRVSFGESVEAALKTSSASVLMINLRRFSRVNESLGGMAGDELIITVARRLLSTLRPTDRLARFGGDEFGVLLGSDGGVDEALVIADRLRQALSTPFRLSELEVRVDSAIGCAVGATGIDGQELIRNAQFAVKSAKASGRVEVYHPAEARLAHRRFAIETDLRRAIERHELTLAYQPVIDLRTDRVAGFEALARWHHPDKGEISPVEFVHVAEEAGLIVPLGRWALAEAAATLASWDAEAGNPLPLTMAVNVSAAQIAHDDVSRAAAEALARTGLAGERMTLELTESVIINDPQRSSRALGALKELRFKIALDDFGTGYSSLAYLQRLPIDLLKIDRSFVTGMLGDRDAVAIVRAVLGLAEALGKATTAEGIETIELARTLGALGCRFGQGFFYVPALAADAAYAFAMSRNA